jgi:hypothetical protein
LCSGDPEKLVESEIDDSYNDMSSDTSKTPRNVLEKFQINKTIENLNALGIRLKIHRILVMKIGL